MQWTAVVDYVVFVFTAVALCNADNACTPPLAHRADHRLQKRPMNMCCAALFHLAGYRRANLSTYPSSVRFIAASPCSIIPAIVGASSFGRMSAIHTKRVREGPSEKTCAAAL